MEFNNYIFLFSPNQNNKTNLLQPIVQLVVVCMKIFEYFLTMKFELIC